MLWQGLPSLGVSTPTLTLERLKDPLLSHISVNEPHLTRYLQNEFHMSVRRQFRICTSSSGQPKTIAIWWIVVCKT
jgi:hypothetical protein